MNQVQVKLCVTNHSVCWCYLTEVFSLCSTCLQQFRGARDIMQTVQTDRQRRRRRLRQRESFASALVGLWRPFQTTVECDVQLARINLQPTEVKRKQTCHYTNGTDCQRADTAKKELDSTPASGTDTPAVQSQCLRTQVSVAQIQQLPVHSQTLAPHASPTLRRP